MNAAVTRASTPPLASDGDSASNKDIREHPGEEGAHCGLLPCSTQGILGSRVLEQ